MFFYTSLFIASLFAALIVLWVYRTVAFSIKSVYKTVLPTSDTGPTSHLKDKAVPITSREKPTPWGWKGHETPANAAKTHAALPTEKPNWGWSGGQQGIHEQNGSYAVSKPAAAGKPGAGWPYREEKSEFAGKAYKVTRKVATKTASTNTADKPWGW